MYGRRKLYLVEKGTNIHINACIYGYLNIVQYLVERGANIHIDDQMPLVKAYEGGGLDVLNIL